MATWPPPQDDVDERGMKKLKGSLISGGENRRGRL